MNVGIYIYDHVEVLDFAGPFEVFSTATRISGESPDPFTVFLIGETGGTVAARAGFSVNPSYGFADHPKIDVLIVPGGMHMEEQRKPRTIAWIAEQGAKAELVASVCTGAFLLAEAGILTDQEVTTHWDDIAGLRSEFPSLTVHENRRWVDQGNRVTSAGISAGIDMSLHLVGRLHGPELAERTARQMEFDRTG